MSYDWNSLDVKEKIMVVTSDILHLLDKLCEKTSPGGEVDSAIELASESFQPLGKLLQVNLEEEDDPHINLNKILRVISSGLDVFSPEAARLLQLEPSLEKSVGDKSASTSSESEQVKHKKDNRNHSKRNVSAINMEDLSKHNPVDRLTQPGPSGLQSQRKDVTLKETFSEKGSKELSLSGPSEILPKTITEERQSLRSANLSQPGSSGKITRSKVIAEGRLKRNYVDQSDARKSKTDKSSVSRRTPGSTSVYESYTHFSSKNKVDSSDESENISRGSSPIY